MMPDDNQKLAVQFMRKAVAVSAGDNVWVEWQGPASEALAEACAAQVRDAGGTPHMVNSGGAELKALADTLDDAALTEFGEAQLAKMKTMAGYIRICDDEEDALVPAASLQRVRNVLRPMTLHRVNHVRWLVVTSPTQAFAQVCGMPVPEFRELYLKVCLLDYARMTEAVKPLQELIRTGKNVRIIGDETDVTFSIEGIGAATATGRRNIPDGECYTAPVKNSLNGHIKFGPSMYLGEKFGVIRMRLENGKVVEASAENAERTAALNRILDTDEGARYAGEFAIAFNPYILHPTSEILFDEKISGSIHFAWGNCYDHVSNGNKSAIHWDTVHIQRPEYGGGEIWIDGRLIRKNGLFVVPELQGLNPAALMSDVAAPSITPRSLQP